MDTARITLYLYAETPIHSGTGTGLGAVDLPIQREKHTGYPIVQASGIKGALRDTAEIALGRESIEVRNIFGAATGTDGGDFAGAMSPSDARILLFPVRALVGVFVWLTSPTVLQRYKREVDDKKAPGVPDIAAGTALTSSASLIVSNQIMLEEYAYNAQVNDYARQWADYLANNALQGDHADFWKERLRTHLVILPDEDFRDFVLYSTEIVTRIHLDDSKKTVKDGQLFSQELLPADSVLYSCVLITGTRDRSKTFSASTVLSSLRRSIGERLQIGGDETVGRGRVRIKWPEEQS